MWLYRTNCRRKNTVTKKQKEKNNQKTKQNKNPTNKQANKQFKKYNRKNVKVVQRVDPIRLKR